MYLETSNQPMHVCSIMELDTSTMPGGYTFDRLQDASALRIKAMPEFREKLANSALNLDHPVWVDDEDFQLHRHLHRIGLPPPGAGPSSPKSAVTSPHCRWTAAARSGRCG
ncbi:wax ester synthase-like Acyl-CoA acyltransferase domain protein [Mycobacterium ulcerans str. Harvey]|uniref:Wax ester synthase-like Acyl-CoA acyltransferase domain protein n=1 Tax=Mycobacterium ulcerans str. Harvey TaxID=1299332 RepID=A0ABN0R2M2_MYCUL|nr:wax ester synthase-like Acyl-CoA acyltransferase domain protein [Mycobacterium ulcerans str. Harvey]